jgi:3-oxoacyl-(acyl-carrier-protein) synthase
LGDFVIKERSAFLAHGAGTPLNRITESHIMSTFAKEFGNENLPVSSVTSKLGHTRGAAGMDQIWCAVGAVESQKLTGICTILMLAEDVCTDG